MAGATRLARSDIARREGSREQMLNVLDPTPVSDPDPGFRPEFEMRFRSVRVQRLPRFAIDRHAAEVPFL